MNSFAKTIGITLLTAATAFAPLTTVANAGDGHWNRQTHRPYDDPMRLYNYREYSERRQQNRQPYNYRRGNQRPVYHHRNNNDAIALGIIGLGAAAIIGGAIANSNNPRVIYQQPSAPRAARSGGYEPWSRSWMRYCSEKYRSFNASTGTYRGYDGQDHFCVVN